MKRGKMPPTTIMDFDYFIWCLVMNTLFHYFDQAFGQEAFILASFEDKWIYFVLDMMLFFWTQLYSIMLIIIIEYIYI